MYVINSVDSSWGMSAALCVKTLLDLTAHAAHVRHMLSDGINFAGSKPYISTVSLEHTWY